MDQKERELRGDGKVAAEAVSGGGPESVSPDERSPKNNPPRSDELFLQGQALYQRGLYEGAIHVWTRILFLERGDARAKSAIERAKRAVAERQRELDAELAVASRLLESGAIDEAAAKLRDVLAVDPRHGEAHHLAERIVALQRRTGVRRSASAARADSVDEPASAKRGLLLRVSTASGPDRERGSNGSPLRMAGFVLGAILVFASGALYLHLNWESIVSDGAFGPASALAPVDDQPTVGSVPTSSELHYFNGARLYAKGSYREALVELNLVARDDAVAERARSLVLRIEERLLRGASAPDVATEVSEPAR